MRCREAGACPTWELQSPHWVSIFSAALNYRPLLGLWLPGLSLTRAGTLLFLAFQIPERGGGSYLFLNSVLSFFGGFLIFLGKYLDSSLDFIFSMRENQAEVNRVRQAA